MTHPASEALSPQQPGPGLPFVGALLVHMAIGTAMLLAVHRPVPEEPVVQAELWASLPPLQPAAATAPQEPPVPDSVTAQAPAPPPEVKTEAPAPEPDIALEKKRLEEERQRKEQEAVKARADKERLAQQKSLADRLAREKAASEKATQEKAARENAAKERAAAEEAARLARQKAAEEKRQRDAAIKKEVDRQRREQEELVLKQLGNDAKARPADEGKDRTTKAGVSGGAKIGDRSGVLASYVAAIRAHVRENIRGFDPSRAPNNPEVVFEVVQTPAGLISSITLKQSSGNTAWDNTVERAIRASSPLPKASDGSVEPLLTLAFRPQDPR